MTVRLSLPQNLAEHLVAIFAGDLGQPLHQGGRNAVEHVDGCVGAGMRLGCLVQPVRLVSVVSGPPSTDRLADRLAPGPVAFLAASRAARFSEGLMAGGQSWREYLPLIGSG